MARFGKLVVALLAVVLADCSFGETTIVKQDGDMLMLSCSVGAGGGVKWRFNGVDITGESSVSGTAGSMNSTITKEKFGPSNAGLYECTNSQTGELLNNFTIIGITIGGEDATITASSVSAEISCLVNNSDLSIQSIKWMRNGTLIADNSSRYSIVSSDRQSTLNISMPGTADAGLYACTVMVEGMADPFEHSLSVNMAPKAGPIPALRGKVEGETATIECNVTGFPIPKITWYKTLEDQEETMVEVDSNRVNTTANSQGVPNATLVIKELKIKTDRGDYRCKAENNLGFSNATVSLRVKDKLAAVWPFLGICAEVAILCSIIFIFEKRRSRKLEEEEEEGDATKQNLMNHANGDDREVRQRNAVRS